MNSVLTNTYKTQVFNSRIVIDNVESNLDQAVWYVLTKCLKHQSNNLNTLEEVYYQLEEYYAASTSISLIKRSDKLEIHLAATMVGGIDSATVNASKVLDLLVGQVYSEKPITQSIFDKEKNKINLSYQNWKNNKQAVAIQNGLNKIEESLLTSKLNDPKFINQVTLEMVNQKKAELAKLKMQDVYFIGNEIPSGIIRDEIYTNQYSKFTPKKVNENFKAKEYVQVTANAQSYLIMFWSIQEILTPQEAVILQIANSIFGSSPNSKLFMNIREKHSLSYHTSSAYIDGINVIMGFAGIQADKFDLAKKVMLEQMNDLKNGVISNEELRSAKQRYAEMFKSATDTADNLVLVNSILNTLSFETTDQALDFIDSIEIKDIKTIVKKINSDALVYFEKGEINE
jgi:hypothetical protein